MLSKENRWLRYELCGFCGFVCIFLAPDWEA